MFGRGPAGNYRCHNTESGTDKKTMAVITFDPGTLLRDEGVANMLGDARVGAPREYPRPSGLGRLQQAFPQAPVRKKIVLNELNEVSSTFASFRPFEAWLQLEVGLAAVDGDEQLGPLQPPLAQEQRQHQLGLRVVRQPDVLEWGDKRKTIQNDISV